MNVSSDTWIYPNFLDQAKLLIPFLQKNAKCRFGKKTLKCQRSGKTLIIQYSSRDLVIARVKMDDEKTASAVLVFSADTAAKTMFFEIEQMFLI